MRVWKRNGTKSRSLSRLTKTILLVSVLVTRIQSKEESMSTERTISSVRLTSSRKLIISKKKDQELEGASLSRLTTFHRSMPKKVTTPSESS